MEVGALRHVIARRFPLSEVAVAHDAVDSDQTSGKIVVEIE
jgi:NADPH:quinone reductase-like Zn-dependent oxidoreductase